MSVARTSIAAGLGDERTRAVLDASTLLGMEVLRWSELVVRCGTPARARTALADGAWRRVLRDAYVEGHQPDLPVTRLAALRRVLPPDAVASHRTALWALGLDVLGNGLELTVPRGRDVRPRPGVVVRRALLREGDLCELEGLVLTSAARAVVDIARREPLVEAVAVGDAVLRSGATSLPLLDAAVGAAAHLRGVRAARAVLPHLEPRSESLMESRLRMGLVLGGLPRPRAQVDVYDARGHVGRLDLELDGVGLEFDGRAARLDPAVFVAERRRQNRLAEAGVELRRFTASDVYGRDPRDLADEVRRAVAQARRRPVRLGGGPDTLRAPRLRPLATLAERRPAA